MVIKDDLNQIPRSKPKEKLPTGWHWVWRVEPKSWAASCGARGGTHDMFFCDADSDHGSVCWDTCDDAVPVAVVLAVLKANGLL